MKDIAYSSISEQIEKLKSQGLIIKDEVLAANVLLLYGYSNLIKSYREPYTITAPDGKKHFRSGIEFEQLLSLYLLDKNLRNAVMASMLDLEEHIKEAAADVITSSFGTNQKNYLKYSNFQNKKKRIQNFSLTSTLKKMEDTLNSGKDPIHYYSEKYEIVPPWILFKSVYFSTMANFIDQFKTLQSIMMVEHLYQREDFNLSDAQIIRQMMDMLFICLDYRNRAAHGGRIYNYTCSRCNNIAHGLNQLLYVLSQLKYRGPMRQLESVLNGEINRHCQLYPEDITYLSSTMNINITISHPVYISKNSTKYHTDAHCSGIRDAMTLEEQEARSRGYTPCKRCCK